MGSSSNPQGLPFLLLLFLPALRELNAGAPSMSYQLTAVSAAPPGTPKFWATGWLGPQLFLTYTSGGTAEPWGAWRWETQESWFWERETWYLKTQERLLQEALRLSKGAQTFQGLVGCQLNSDNSSQPTARFALDGKTLLTFDPMHKVWLGDTPEAWNVKTSWANESQRAEKDAEFLLTTCPQKLQSHLQKGHGNFQWKEPPEVRVGARVGPESAWSTLTCQAFSFFPPELELTFLREGKPQLKPVKEVEAWPNGNGAFHLRGTLEVPFGDEGLYSCEVQHSALTSAITVKFETIGGLPLPIRTSLVAGILLFLASLAALVAFVIIYRRRHGRLVPWMFRRQRGADDVGSLLSVPDSAQDPGP
ncbi:IgG receptor FcRn large subunit p51 [Macrotis lagotis]|uniref:IgG receptor FcRn large subunit p51 n=1 Tax=Macrotis lagotis TaxID=92651 RepID=UPI003D699A96